MEIAREKLKENVHNYRVEAIMATMQYLKSHQFEFMKEIGCGSFVTVLEFKDNVLKSNVAGKIVLQEYVSESEKKIWLLVSHENLLPLMRMEHNAPAYTYVLYNTSTSRLVTGNCKRM